MVGAELTIAHDKALEIQLSIINNDDKTKEQSTRGDAYFVLEQAIEKVTVLTGIRIVDLFGTRSASSSWD